MIDVSGIVKAEGAVLSVTEELVLSPFTYSGVPFEVHNPVLVKGTLVNHQQVLGLEATADVTVVTDCMRCQEKAALLLPLSFSADFKPAGPEDAEAEDNDFFTFQSQCIDLEEALMEQILLALPMQVLCREACKGICPNCGQNLNKVTCSCVHQSVDPRLSKLQSLLDK